MSELDKIRAITNDEPAPPSEAPPPMVCPACGDTLAQDFVCINPACETRA